MWAEIKKLCNHALYAPLQVKRLYCACRLFLMINNAMEWYTVQKSKPHPLNTGIPMKPDDFVGPKFSLLF